MQPSAPAHVESLQDAFRWVEFNLGVLQRECSLDGIATRLRNTRLSTSFSGTGGAENALDAIVHGLRRFTPGGCSPPTNEFAVEWFDESRYELRMLRNPPKHVFTDICDFIHPSFSQELKGAATNMSYESLRSLLTQRGKCLLEMSAFCVVCGKRCTATRCDVHVAGTPCVAWSRLGKREFASGVTLLPFMIWVGMRRALQETCVLHENVQDFDTGLFEELLGDLYVVKTCILNAAHFGQHTERVRRFTWLMHKTSFVQRLRNGTPLVDWDSRFVDKFRRELRTTWSDLFELASPEEILEEARWAAARKDVPPVAGTLTHATNFENLLLDYETRFLRRYKEMGCVASVVGLHSNPDERIASNKSKTHLANSNPQQPPDVLNCTLSLADATRDVDDQHLRRLRAPQPVRGNHVVSIRPFGVGVPPAKQAPHVRAGRRRYELAIGWRRASMVPLAAQPDSW